MDFLQACDAEYCVYNRDRFCGRETPASIGYKSSGEFRNGERVVYAVCEDYKELEDES